MNAYIRSTRECTFADLRPELVISIRKHIEKYRLEDIESPDLLRDNIHHPKNGALHKWL